MKYLLLTFISGLLSVSLFAQQDLFRENQIISPEINADHTVTFRIMAPDAATVSVSGSLDAEKAFAPITYEMKKDNNGVWSYTTPVLPSEFLRD